jgi:Amt family ammonium transporter
MDLDQFKVVNDTCGHRVGDKLLVELTDMMRHIIREQDVLSRLGRDELGLLMSNVSKGETATISDRLFGFFQNYVFHQEDKAFAVHASIGVVHIDESCNTLQDVMAAADNACYAAKDARRNSMYVFSPTDDTLRERSRELSWLPRLQNALQYDEFCVYLQPIASLDGKRCTRDTMHVEHVEFLLRLPDPDGTQSTPWHFIRAAERYDLMQDIDKSVIRHALRTVAGLEGGPASSCTFPINLSCQSAADPSRKDFIR